MVIDGAFNVTDWNESTVAELGPGAKLTEAKVTQQFGGGMSGDGSVTWLMCYASPTSARFVGMQRFSGTIGGRQGSFVLETVGDFNGSVAKGRWSVVPGSGTGGLAGITGTGQFEAPHGPTATYRLDYALEEPSARG